MLHKLLLMAVAGSAGTLARYGLSKAVYAVTGQVGLGLGALVLGYSLAAVF